MLFNRLSNVSKWAMALAVALSTVEPSSALAAFQEKRKLAQFGIEPKLECVNWTRIFGADQCIGHAVKFLQHEFTLIANGPDLDQAVRPVLEKALGLAASAAISTGMLTPSPEPAARISAAIAAGKAAFVGYLAAHGLEQIAAKYEIRIDHRTFW